MSLPPDLDDSVDTGIAPAPEPTEPRLVDRFRSRLRNDLRNALIDPAQQPAGDFDIVVQSVAGRSGDRVAGFNGLITALRFVTTTIAVLLVATSSDADVSLRVWTALVVAYAVFRAFRPIEYADDVQSLLRVMAEVGLHVLAVIATGAWDSPLVFTLLSAVTVAGLARGFGFSLRVAIASIVAVSFPFIEQADDLREALITSASWGSIVLIVAVISGYARRISGEADRERELAIDRLSRLSDANTLLFSLHRVTQTLAGLAGSRRRARLDPAAAEVPRVLRQRRRAALRRDRRPLGRGTPPGPHVASRLGPTELTVGLRRAIAENAPSTSTTSPPPAAASRRVRGRGSTPVAARGSIIGLLAIEHADLDHFTARDLELLEGFVAPASLALDNARWFARLRTVGADEERTRIARDLHDRIGQSLAYLAFELDRIVDRDGSGEPLTDELDQLREDVRGVIREVRDTLYDLRTDVSDEQGLGEVLEQFVRRVGDRSDLHIQIEADRHARLPMLQEREMWRITQEALANVERHAGASAVRVVWRCDGQRALIDVTDNGVGFEPARPGGSTPTACSECASGRPASAPLWRSSALPAVAPGCGARCCPTTNAPPAHAGQLAHSGAAAATAAAGSGPLPAAPRPRIPPTPPQGGSPCPSD